MSERTITAVAHGGPFDGQTKTFRNREIRIPEKRGTPTLVCLDTPGPLSEPVYWEHTYALDESQTPPVWAYKGEVRKGTMREMEESAQRYLDAREANK